MYYFTLKSEKCNEKFNNQIPDVNTICYSNDFDINNAENLIDIRFEDINEKERVYFIDNILDYFNYIGDANDLLNYLKGENND